MIRDRRFVEKHSVGHDKSLVTGNNGSGEVGSCKRKQARLRSSTSHRRRAIVGARIGCRDEELVQDMYCSR